MVAKRVVLLTSLRRTVAATLPLLFVAWSVGQLRLQRHWQSIDGAVLHEDAVGQMSSKCYP